MDQIPINFVGDIHQDQEQDEVQIVCEINYNQAFINEAPAQQFQEVAGPYDDWQDEVQIVEEIVYPREMPYVILPGQPGRSYYDEEPKNQGFMPEQKELFWRPRPGQHLDPVQAMAMRLKFEQNQYEVSVEEFKEQQAEMAAMAAEGDDAEEEGLDDLEDEDDDDGDVGPQGDQAPAQMGVPRIVYR